jgi:hypothetical protein
MLLQIILFVGLTNGSSSPKLSCSEYISCDEELGHSQVRQDEEEGFSRSRLDSTQSDDGLLLHLLDSVSTTEPKITGNLREKKLTRFGSTRDLRGDGPCGGNIECGENVRFFCFLTVLAIMGTLWGSLRAS